MYKVFFTIYLFIDAQGFSLFTLYSDNDMWVDHSDVTTSAQK